MHPVGYSDIFKTHLQVYRILGMYFEVKQNKILSAESTHEIQMFKILIESEH
jgi:hypothetical protein